MKSFFFLSVLLISACQTKSSAKNPGEINSYRLTDYSVFPTTSMTFKSKDKKNQRLKIPPEECWSRNRILHGLRTTFPAHYSQRKIVFNLNTEYIYCLLFTVIYI